MLLQFSVKNYKCFRDEVTLSMLAADHVERLPGDSVAIPGVGRVLKVAAIYGANASGKSTVLSALTTLAIHARRGTSPDEPALELAFALTPEARRSPTRWELSVWAEDTAWNYILTILDGTVIEEALSTGTDGSETVWFHRQSGRESTSVTWGEGLTSAGRTTEFLGYVAEGCRPTQPLLAELNSRFVTEIRPLVGWLFRLVWEAGEEPHAWSDGTTPQTAVAARAATDPGFLEFVQQFVVAFDPTVEEIALRGELDAGDEDRWRLARDERIWLEFTPQGADVSLRTTHLSAGTRRIMELAHSFYLRATKWGGVVLIDELSRNLHPLLAQRLLRTARDASAESQLIFTTHNTGLLDPALLPPDSVWFVDKAHDGAASLYSLAEFKPEQISVLSNDLQRAYLDGRFGGTPQFGGLRRLAAAGGTDG